MNTGGQSQRTQDGGKDAATLRAGGMKRPRDADGSAQKDNAKVVQFFSHFGVLRTLACTRVIATT